VLIIEDLKKVFPAGKKETRDVHAVDGVSFDIKEGEFFTLLGPSGCGKTTTLRSVAGLEDPTSGRIAVAEQVLYDSSKNINVRVNARGLGMVFQSYAIWPHMNVFKNVAFPLTVRPRAKRPGKAEIRDRVERVLSVVHLDHLMDRPATDLSGGQQQRLALARALVMEPPLLLLDEPLSNLDAKLREQMRFELKRLQRDLNITAVYVTHDQVEALSMSSRIAVMNNGKVEQLGKPREIYNAPASRFVADFIGTSNFCDGVVKAREGTGTYRITAGPGELIATSDLDLPTGTKVIVSIRPEQIGIADEGTAASDVGVWKAEVTARGFMGDIVEHELAVGDMVLRMRSNPEVSIPPGEQILITLPPRWCTLIPA
jgi:iron(III) transport system ATP-binding protein